MVPQLYIARTPDGNGLPLPSYTSKYHVGLNLMGAIGSPIKIAPNERIKIPVGFAIGIPNGYCGQIVSHPEMAEVHGLIVSDAPHILHPADRKPIFLLIHNVSTKPYILHRKELIAQLVIMPIVQVCWQEVQVKEGGEQTDENTLMVDEGTGDATDKSAGKKFVSFRRHKTSPRNRFKIPGVDNA